MQRQYCREETSGVWEVKELRDLVPWKALHLRWSIGNKSGESAGRRPQPEQPRKTALAGERLPLFSVLYSVQFRSPLHPIEGSADVTVNELEV